MRVHRSSYYEEHMHLGGLLSRKSWSCDNEGLKRESLAARASSKGTDPPIALATPQQGEKKELQWQILNGDWPIDFYMKRIRRCNLAVHSATAFPAPQKSASSSMPSSKHTVLSTSKHIASAFFQTSSTSTNKQVSIYKHKNKWVQSRLYP